MGLDGSQLKPSLGKAAGLPLPSADNWLWLSLVVTASISAGVLHSAWWGGGQVCLFWMLWMLPQSHLDLQGLEVWGVKHGV